jgi:hypothetical protein
MRFEYLKAIFADAGDSYTGTLAG